MAIRKRPAVHNRATVKKIYVKIELMREYFRSVLYHGPTLINRKFFMVERKNYLNANANMSTKYVCMQHIYVDCLCVCVWIGTLQYSSAVSATTRTSTSTLQRDELLRSISFLYCSLAFLPSFYFFFSSSRPPSTFDIALTHILILKKNRYEIFAVRVT